MSETPSGRSSPTSTGRSSPTNDASDDPAAAISRIASLFQSLNRLRDAGYGASVIAAKVAECRAAVVSLPPDLQAQVVALVNAIDDELEGDGAAPVDDVDEIPFGLLDLPPPVLALCCVFAGDSGSLVPRLARTCRAGGEVKPEVMQSRSARESNVLVAPDSLVDFHTGRSTPSARASYCTACRRTRSTCGAARWSSARRRRIGWACGWTARSSRRACGAST